MSNRWIDVIIDDTKITGAELMKNMQQDSKVNTILNHANFKKLKMNEPISKQIKNNSKWEVIPKPKSS